MTGDHQRRPRRAVRAVLWLPGLAVALGAAAATAHGLYEVALAAAVPAGIAWLYPLITDGLALVAYGATARLTGSAARYAWAVVVIAAGLSGLAQAAFLASGATLAASPALRFGVGAWPAVAAAVAAHLLYLLTAEHSTEPHTRPDLTEVADRLSAEATAVTVQPGPSNRPAVQHQQPAALTASPRPTGLNEPRPTPPSTALDASSTSPVETARVRARTAALRHAARHGALPTVSALAAAADVSRGTAATVLKPLRGRPLPLHLIHTEPGPAREADDDAIEEHNQP